MNELKSIFGNRIISRTAEVEWPSRSPDLNPLDYSFWGQAMKAVWDAKPATIDELVTVVEDFFENIPEDSVRKTVANIIKRAELCVSQSGGHFEHLL